MNGRIGANGLREVCGSVHGIFTIMIGGSIVELLIIEFLLIKPRKLPFTISQW